MLRVASTYSFSALTAVLAGDYFDKFLSSLQLQADKLWITQLAVVACISLAAKVEETQVPLLLDFQVEDSKYVFEARTIKRMEILVLSTLQWKMNHVSKSCSSLINSVRIARIVYEGFKLGLPNVRWFVIGDDDTVSFSDNQVSVLARYDHDLTYHLARMWPERVEKVVIANSGVNMRRGDHEALLKRAKLEKIEELMLPSTAAQLNKLLSLAMARRLDIIPNFLSDIIQQQKQNPLATTQTKPKSPRHLNQSPVSTSPGSKIRTDPTAPTQPSLKSTSPPKT
ncbi:hypothetical protein ACFX1Q_022946 [Malus domestica]